MHFNANDIFVGTSWQKHILPHTPHTPTIFAPTPADPILSYPSSQSRHQTHCPIWSVACNPRKPMYSDPVAAPSQRTVKFHKYNDKTYIPTIFSLLNRLEVMGPGVSGGSQAAGGTLRSWGGGAPTSGGQARGPDSGRGAAQGRAVVRRGHFHLTLIKLHSSLSAL